MVFFSVLPFGKPFLGPGSIVCAAKGYKQYFNDKYQYSVDYPVWLVAEGESDASDGQRFSAGARMVMSVSGTYSNWLEGREMSIKEQYDWDLVHLKTRDGLPGAQISFKRCGKNDFVISGYSRDNIFYQRTVKGRESFVTLVLLYPKLQKSAMDPVVSHVALSIRAFD